MTKPIFSRNYFASGQRKFEKAIADENLEEARVILEGLPSYSTREEKLLRRTAQLEGYRALVRAYEKWANEKDKPTGAEALEDLIDSLPD